MPAFPTTCKGFVKAQVVALEVVVRGGDGNIAGDEVIRGGGGKAGYCLGVSGGSAGRHGAARRVRVYTISGHWMPSSLTSVVIQSGVWPLLERRSRRKAGE